MIDDHTTKQLSNLILFVVSPAIMLVSFQQAFAVKKLVGFVIAFLYSIIGILIAVIISKLFFNKKEGIESYACGFSNAGFIGIPLVQAVIGTEAVFYLTAFLVVFNILTWTIGIKLITGKSNFNLIRFITNPAIITVIFGLIIFIFQVRLPLIVDTTLKTVGNMNTPLGMIILGTYVASGKVSYIFTSKSTYLVCLVRLLIAPLVIFVFLTFAYVPYE